MRKFFALALAVAMVLSLASVSFAATYTDADVALTGPYRYDSDKNQMIAPGVDANDALRYGSGVYYLIKVEDVVTAAGSTPVLDAETNGVPTGIYKEIEKMKVKAEFEMGEDLVESVSIVKKYVDVDASYVEKSTPANTAYNNGTDVDFQIVTDAGWTIENTPSDNGYYYFVEFMIANKTATADADIIGTLEFNRKADKDVKGVNYGTDTGIGKIKDVENDFSFNVFYKDTWLVDTTLEIANDIDLKYDTNYALKFNNDDEVELTFGKGEFNEGTFSVDVSGQGKIFLNYNTKADEAIAAANPGAKMFFLNFNNAKFNRVGTFEYEMDGMVAAYKVVDGQLVEINGLELDVDTATFSTRVLESYVFADAELVNPVVEAPVVEAPAAVTNPSTGF